MIASTVPSADGAMLSALLARVARGERPALERLYRCTSARLYGVTLHILDDRAHAEDALQEVFLAIWRRADSFDPARGSAITWLLALARNAAVDRRRQVLRPGAAPLPPPIEMTDPAPGVLAGMLAKDERARLRTCMGELEARDRQYIAASFLEGSTYPELAERAAVPLPTIKSRIRRALLRLRSCMG